MPLTLPHNIKARYEVQACVSEDLLTYRYVGKHVDTGDDVWIWEFKSDYLDGPVIQSLIQGADSLMSLDAPGVARILDYDYDGEHFLVMTESLSGGQAMDAYLGAKGQFSLKQLWGWCTDLLSTLSQLESKGIAHGALSYRMIWVMPDQSLKLVLPLLYATVLQQSLADFEVIDDLVFLSPELIQFQQLDARSDMYSMGVLMFTFFSRSWPYPYTDFVKEHKKHLLDQHKPYHPFSEKLPDKLGALIQRCLMKDPGNRFETFTELVKAYKTKVSLDVEAAREAVVDHAIQKDLQDQRFGFLFSWLKVGLVGLVFGALIVGGMSLKKSFFNSIPDKRVPDMIGLSVDQGQSILADFGLDSVVAGGRFHATLPEGAIVGSKPPPGRDVKANRVVRLFLSKGIPQVLVPDFVGRPLERVEQLAHERQHGIEVIGEVYSDLYQKGVVIRQSPTPNSFLSVSQNVQVEVSKGYPVSFSMAAAEPWFFVKKDNLRRVSVTFQVLDAWPAQDVRMVFRYENREEVLYQRTKQPGQQDYKNFELELGGVVEFYFNDELAVSFTVEDPVPLDDAQSLEKQ